MCWAKQLPAVAMRAFDNGNFLNTNYLCREGKCPVRYYAKMLAAAENRRDDQVCWSLLMIFGKVKFG